MTEQAYLIAGLITQKNGTSGSLMLKVENLVVDFPNNPAGARALEGISLSLEKGEILGLVGESGSGKSLFAKSLIRLEFPAKIISGSILFNGEDLANKSQKEMRRLRGDKIFLVMQDPKTTMDPVFTMGHQFKEVVSLYGGLKGDKGRKKAKVSEKIYELLRSVGIASPKERCRQYPHEWSRGMLQRGQLVTAFSSSPELLILDEVTSALDPTVCLQILDLIIRLKKENSSGILLITHDLSVAHKVCNRVAVMQKGSIVETGTVREIFDKPVHPYTCLLVSSMFEDLNS